MTGGIFPGPGPEPSRVTAREWRIVFAIGAAAIALVAWSVAG